MICNGSHERKKDRPPSLKQTGFGSREIEAAAEPSNNAQDHSIKLSRIISAQLSGRTGTTRYFP